MTSELYTLREVAQILKLKPNTVKGYILQQKMSATIVGRFYRVSEEQLQEFLSRNTIQTKGE